MLLSKSLFHELKVSSVLMRFCPQQKVRRTSRLTCSLQSRSPGRWWTAPSDSQTLSSGCRCLEHCDENRGCFQLNHFSMCGVITLGAFRWIVTLHVTWLQQLLSADSSVYMWCDYTWCFQMNHTTPCYMITAATFSWIISLCVVWLHSMLSDESLHCMLHGYSSYFQLNHQSMCGVITPGAFRWIITLHVTWLQQLLSAESSLYVLCDYTWCFQMNRYTACCSSYFQLIHHSMCCVITPGTFRWIVTLHVTAATFSWFISLCVVWLHLVLSDESLHCMLHGYSSYFQLIHHSVCCRITAGALSWIFLCMLLDIDSNF